MADLLRYQSKDLYRSKGVLAFAEEGNAKFIFQGVHENIQYSTALEDWKEDEPKVSKCVLIGRNLDHDKLREKWRKCIAPEGYVHSTSSSLSQAAARLKEGLG